MVATFAAGCAGVASAEPKAALAAPPAQKSDYELFNCNNFSIRYWSWNYRGCWHQTCPPMEFVKVFRLYSFQSTHLY